MEEQKKILETVVKALPVSYFLGFLIINGYLSNYGFSDFNVLSATYLKAGVQFAVIIAFILMAVYFAHGKEKPTDDFKKSWPTLVVSIYNLSLLCAMLLPLTINSTGLFIAHSSQFLIYFASLFLHGFIRIWADGKIANNNLGVLFLNLLPLFFLAPAIIILTVYLSASMTLLILIYVLGIISWVSLGLHGDNTYNNRLFTDICVLIIACFFFGKNVFGKIPYSFGGGQPYEIIFKNQKETLGNINVIAADTLLVLYENDERFLLKNGTGEILFTQKSELKTYYIRQKAGVDTFKTKSQINTIIQSGKLIADSSQQQILKLPSVQK